MVAQLDRDYIQTRPTKALNRLVSHVLFQGRPLTTSLRWMNPLLLGFYSLIMRAPQVAQVRQPIFVLGTGRSGTTILGVLLSLHPQVGFLNEPKALWHAIYPDEDIIGSYSRAPGRYRLAAADASAATVRKAQRLYGFYQWLTRCSRVVDKYPELIFRVPFVQAIFPDAKFILISRDGWDTVHSIATWSRNAAVRVRPGKREDWWGADQRKWRLLVDEVVCADPALAPLHDEIARLERQEDLAAVEWIATTRQGLSLLSSLPDAAHLVRYETLIAQPRQTLTRLLDFCQLPGDEFLLQYAERKLRLVAPKPPFELHPAIRPLFLDTVNESQHYGA